MGLFTFYGERAITNCGSRLSLSLPLLRRAFAPVSIFLVCREGPIDTPARQGSCENPTLSPLGERVDRDGAFTSPSADGDG
jgi:hypothetical protein